MKEIRGQHPAEWHLVAEFYREWTKQSFVRPTSKELALGRQMIVKLGSTRAAAALRVALRLLKEKWPEAKSFAAVSKYLPEAMEELRKIDQRKAIEKADAAREAMEAERRADETTRLAAAQDHWTSLPESEREEIRSRVRQTQPKILELKQPELFNRLCVREYAARPSLVR